MTLNIKLEIPNLDLLDSYIDALREGHYIGIQPKATNAEIQAICDNPDGFLKTKQPDYNPDGVVETPDGTVFEMVPYETLWASLDGVFVGDLSLRLKLNALLENFGGHVGYGVRPAFQGRGVATQMLALARDRARGEHGIDTLLLTCDADNPASERVIQHNDAVFIRNGNKPYGFGPGQSRFYHVPTKRMTP